MSLFRSGQIKVEHQKEGWGGERENKNTNPTKAVITTLIQNKEDFKVKKKKKKTIKSITTEDSIDWEVSYKISKFVHT